MNKIKIDLNKEIEIKRVLDILGIEYKNNFISSSYKINVKDNYVKDFSGKINNGKSLYPISLYAYYQNLNYAEAKKELEQRFFSITRNVKNYSPATNISKTSTNNKKESIEINMEALKCFYDFFSKAYNANKELKKEYETKYYKKRGIANLEDVAVYTEKIAKQFIKEYPKESKELSYHNLFRNKKDNIEINKNMLNRLMFFHFDFNNKPIYITSYLFEQDYNKNVEYYKCYDKNSKKYEINPYKKTKKINLFNTKLKAYGLNSINKIEIKNNSILVGESVEKIKPYIYCDYSGFSIGGIEQKNVLINAIKEIKENLPKEQLEKLEIVISFDQRKNSINNQEVTSIINHYKEGIFEGFKVSVIEIEPPRIYSKEESVDLTDYTKNMREDNLKRYINKLVKKRIDINKFIIKKGKEKKEKTYPHKKDRKWNELNKNNNSRNDVLEIKEIKEKSLISESIKSYRLLNENKGNLRNLIIAPAGTGKTFSMINYAKEKPIIYITEQTKLIDDVLDTAKKLGVKSFYHKSMSETCKDTHLKYGYKETNINENTSYSKLKEVINKGYSTKNICSNCPIKNKCPILSTEIHQEKIKKDTRLLLMTIDKFLSGDTQNWIKENFGYHHLFIDESIKNKFLEKSTIDNNEYLKINKIYSEYIEKTNLEKSLQILEFIFKNIPQEKTLTSKNLFNFYNNNNRNLEQDLKEISINELEQELKNLVYFDIKNIDNLPNNKSFISFIRAVKHKFNNTSLINGTIFINEKINKLENSLNKYKNVTFIDATGSINIISSVLNIPKENIVLNEFKGINPNAVYYQDTNKSWKASSLDKGSKNYEYLTRFIKLKALEDPNNKIFIVVPLSVEKNLIEDPFLNDVKNQITIKHHYSLRGLNNFDNHNICITTDTKVNYENLENDIFFILGNEFKNEIRSEKTNVINNNKYLEIEQVYYKDNTVNDFLKEQTSKEIYQDIQRINRKGTEKKEFFILGQTNLSDVIHQDINDFSVKVYLKEDNKKGIRKKSEYENFKFILDTFINEVGFFTKGLILNITDCNLTYNKDNIAENIINSTFGINSNIIYNRIKNVINNLSSSIHGIFNPLNIEKCFDNYLKGYIKDFSLLSEKISIYKNDFYSPIVFYSKDKNLLDNIKNEIRGLNDMKKQEIKSKILRVNFSNNDNLKHEKTYFLNDLDFSIFDKEQINCKGVSFEYFKTGKKESTIRAIKKYVKEKISKLEIIDTDNLFKIKQWSLEVKKDNREIKLIHRNFFYLIIFENIELINNLIEQNRTLNFDLHKKVKDNSILNNENDSPAPAENKKDNVISINPFIDKYAGLNSKNYSPDIEETLYPFSDLNASNHDNSNYIFNNNNDFLNSQKIDILLNLVIQNRFLTRYYEIFSKDINNYNFEKIKEFSLIIEDYLKKEQPFLNISSYEIQAFISSYQYYKENLSSINFNLNNSI